MKNGKSRQQVLKKYLMRPQAKKKMNVLRKWNQKVKNAVIKKKLEK